MGQNYSFVVLSFSSRSYRHPSSNSNYAADAFSLLSKPFAFGFAALLIVVWTFYFQYVITARNPQAWGYFSPYFSLICNFSPCLIGRWTVIVTRSDNKLFCAQTVTGNKKGLLEPLTALLFQHSLCTSTAHFYKKKVNMYKRIFARLWLLYFQMFFFRGKKTPHVNEFVERNMSRHVKLAF